MEITGALTGNAVIAEVKNTDRKVVNFTMAVNDTYRVKGSTEVKKHTTYFDCAYWVGTGVAKLLTKGSIVTVTGRLNVSAYADRNGNPKAALRFHVDKIKVQHSKPSQAAVTEASPSDLLEPLDDLPF